MSGTDIAHCYTVIPPSLTGDHSNEQKFLEGRALFMMIKVYRDGLLTPFIGRLQSGRLLLHLLILKLFFTDCGEILTVCIS